MGSSGIYYLSDFCSFKKHQETINGNLFADLHASVYFFKIVFMGNACRLLKKCHTSNFC